jgi:hypothetical protein
MKFKFLVTVFCLALTSSSLLADNIQVFDLSWSSDTPYIHALHDTLSGSGQYTGGFSGTATGQLTLDLDLLSDPPPTPEGIYALPHPAFVSLTMTITGTTGGDGDGTFTLSGFQSAIFDTLGTPLGQPPLSNLDLSYGSNLIGQTLITGAKFGILDPNTVPDPPWINPDPYAYKSMGVGEFAFSSGTDGYPTILSIPFIMLANGGDYLQLTEIIPVPEPGTTLTGIMTLALSGGVFVRSARRRAASR